MRRMTLALSAAGMLWMAPMAMAGTWTMHGEVLKEIQAWVLEHVSTAGRDQVRPELNTRQVQNTPTRPLPTPNQPRR